MTAPKPISVAAADHLAAVEAERDGLRIDVDALTHRINCLHARIAELDKIRLQIGRNLAAADAENSRLRSELEAVQPIIDAAQAVVDWWTDPTETTAVDLFSALHAALAAAREAQP